MYTSNKFEWETQRIILKGRSPYCASVISGERTWKINIKKCYETFGQTKYSTCEYNLNFHSWVFQSLHSLTALETIFYERKENMSKLKKNKYWNLVHLCLLTEESADIYAVGISRLSRDPVCKLELILHFLSNFLLVLLRTFLAS